MATLATDVTELVNIGMLNLDAKLTGIDDEKFLTRLVEVWNFFWVQVLPYVEGVRPLSSSLPSIHLLSNQAQDSWLVKDLSNFFPSI